MKYGKAPYNFVSLSKEPKTIEKDNVEKHNIQKKKNYTGYLGYTIATKNPLFIGSTVEKQENDFDIVHPFEINGQRAIPGSSVRGMIYSIMEILSDSPFKEFEDRQLYFRDIASGGNLSDKYFQQIYDIKKGLLFTDKSSYFISPVDNSNFEFEPNNIKQSEHKDNTFEISGNTIKWRTGLMHKKLKNGSEMFCGEYKFDLPAKEERIPVPKEVFENYYYDEMENKNEAHRIKYSKDGDKKLYLDWAKHFSEKPYSNGAKGVPVFYTLDESGAVKTFGHTQYHRIPHAHKISNFIPRSHNDVDDEKIGIAEALFGTKEDFASRLRFGDALLTSDHSDICKEEGIMKTLMTPKPTAYPFYLKQDSTNPKNLTNYSSDHGEIRGYKLYWNKNEVNWKDNEDNADPKLQKKIQPIKAGVEFSGKIHFNNLTRKELGLLLLALELDDGMFHRLGMGKPYGMGKVKIKVSQVRKIKPEERYQAPESEYLNGLSNKLNTGFFKKHFLESIMSNKRKQSIKYLLTRYFTIRKNLGLKALLSDPINSINGWDQNHSYIPFYKNDKETFKSFKQPLIPLYSNKIYRQVSYGKFQRTNGTYEVILNPSKEKLQIKFEVEDNIDGMEGIVYYSRNSVFAIYANGRFYEKYN